MNQKSLLCIPLVIWRAASVSFILHLAAVIMIGHYHNPILWENGDITFNMLAGKGFSIDFAGPAAPTSWQAPGYPHLLYYFINALGDRPLTYLLISLFQTLLTSLMVFPVYLITRSWYGEKAAVLSAWIIVFMPLYAWYSTRMHQPAIVMSLYPWILLGWLRLEHARRGILIAVGVGLLTGLAALFSPTMLAVFGLFSGLLALQALYRRNLRTFSRIILAGVCTLLAITPWTIRNYQVHERIIPIKNSFPKEFWYGNNPQATGTPFVKGGHAPIDMPDIWPELYGKVSEIEMMDAIAEKTWEYVNSDRTAFVERTLKKVLWFWTAVPRSLLRSSFEGEAVKFYWLHTGYWSVFLLAFFLGIAWKKIPVPPDYRIILGTVFVVYSVVYGLTIVGNARFRGEIEFLFVPMLSAFLIALTDKYFAAKNLRS